MAFALQVVEKSTMEDGSEYETIKNVFDSITLNYYSEYYCSVDNSDEAFYYKIPWTLLEGYLKVGKQYIYVLHYEYNGIEYQTDIYATYGGLTTEDIIQNSINEQTEVLKKYYEKQEQLIQEQTQVAEEQLETSKGIWGTLKSVLNFINPLSEDFFVYKLIDLLLDALKSLFIPNEGFLTSYFDELLNWFSDRLGFLSYPLELILDILNRILTINFSDPVIDIPDIYEPTTNVKFISATSYNLNSLLDNNTLKTCHNIYLILVDAVIVFGLVNLLKHKLEEVFTK